MSRVINKASMVATLLVVVLGLTSGFAQDRERHEIHSMMIYNFLKYIQWPESVNSGQFVIGVMGDDDVYSTLKAWYGDKERMGKTLLVKKLTSPSDARECQLVYIGSAASNSFEAVHGIVSSNPTLIITDKNGLGKRGSGINFRTVNNRLKFELNQNALETSKLKVSSQLAAMAIVI
ncbi:MAG: YfiR family protein [Cyclobacteriaceae bacterium]